MKICPKCQYHRKTTDQAPDWQCPSCGIAYAKFGQTPAGGSATRNAARPAVAPAEPNGSGIKMILVGGFIVALIGFAVWKSHQSSHATPGVANASQFDAAKKAFDADQYGPAMKGFEPLATAGDPKAQYYVGRMYGYTWSEGFNGARHPADTKMQINWFTKSAVQGEVPSQLALGEIYDHGFGETPDRGPGTHWYQQAADTGDAVGQYHLGIAYEQATGLTKDDAQAAAWYRKSASQGNIDALYRLGINYSWGRGVTKNNFIAYKLIGLAKAAGDREGYGKAPIMAANDLTALRAQLSATEIQQGDDVIAKWSVGQPLPDYN